MTQLGSKSVDRLLLPPELRLFLFLIEMGRKRELSRRQAVEYTRLPVKRNEPSLYGPAEAIASSASTREACKDSLQLASASWIQD